MVGFVGVGVVTAAVSLAVAGALGVYPWSRIPSALLNVALVTITIGVVRAWRSPRREPSTLFGLVTSLLLGFALVLPLAGTDRLWPSIWTVFAVSLVVTALNSGVLAARAKGATRGPSEGKRSQ